MLNQKRTEAASADVELDIEVRRAQPVVDEQITLPTKRASYSGQEYVVTNGDNAHLISNRLGVSYAQLAEVNNLASPRDLRVGQRLIVPQARASDPM